MLCIYIEMCPPEWTTHEGSCTVCLSEVSVLIVTVLWQSLSLPFTLHSLHSCLLNTNLASKVVMQSFVYFIVDLLLLPARPISVILTQKTSYILSTLVLTKEMFFRNEFDLFYQVLQNVVN